jgi:predicted RNase H-like HicB family nuclease
MQAKKLILRGYVRPKRDYFLAVCVDLNLVAQGGTVEEALDSLKDAIKGYFEELNENPNFYKETVPRKSPTSFYIEYYCACIFTRFSSTL